MTFKVTREGELAGRGEFVKTDSISRSIRKPRASSTTKLSPPKAQRLRTFVRCELLKTYGSTLRSVAWRVRRQSNQECRKKGKNS